VKQFLRQLIRRLGYHIEGIRYTPKQFLDPAVLRPLEFDDIICRHMFDTKEALTFVQIGAYDGVSTDPLRKYIERCRWEGILVEPQPGPANKLRHLYAKNPRIQIVEAAIDQIQGTRTLYTVESPELPAWAGGMASFDREHILKHEYLLPGLAQKLRELTIPCVTFDDIVSRLRTPHLDLLQIDAEGGDGFLLSLFPFHKIKPAVIQWEVKNLTCSNQEQTLEHLITYGYRIARSGDEDMLAVKGVDD